MLDSSKRFKQTTGLKVEGYNNIFVMSDVGNLQGANANSAEDQVIHMQKIMEAYFALKASHCPSTPRTARREVSRDKLRGRGGRR